MCESPWPPTEPSASTPRWDDAARQSPKGSPPRRLCLAASASPQLQPPQTKNPSWHNIQLALLGSTLTFEEIVLGVLQQHGYGGGPGSPQWARRPAFLQSFEESSLARLGARSDLPLVMLVGGPGWRSADTGATFQEITSGETRACYPTPTGARANVSFCPSRQGPGIAQGPGCSGLGAMEGEPGPRELHFQSGEVDLSIDACLADLGSGLTAWYLMRCPEGQTVVGPNGDPAQHPARRRHAGDGLFRRSRPSQVTRTPGARVHGPE